MASLRSFVKEEKEVDTRISSVDKEEKGLSENMRIMTKDVDVGTWRSLVIV